MRFLLVWLFAALVLVAGAASAQECPECKPIEDWLFVTNAGPCSYHGARLPSICAADPDCVQWNLACNAKRDELRACIARCMAGDPPTPPPTPPQSEAPELDEFDRDMAEMERAGYDPNHNQQSPEWCEEKRRDLAARAEFADRNDHYETRREHFRKGVIGYVAAQMGSTPVVHRCAGLTEGSVRGTPIHIGDCIETGNAGRVRIVLMDRDDALDVNPSVLNFGVNANACFNRFDFHSDELWRTGSLIDLIKGSVRVFFKGWGRNDSVDVRIGVTICGIRGSEVIVRREPSDGSIQVGVIEGHAWLGNRETREIRYLEAGEWAQDRTGGMTPVQPMSRADWDQVVAQDGLDLGGDLPGADCAMAVGSWRWVNGNVFAFSADGRWTITNGDGSGNWRCETNSYGDSEVVITPDAGGWWTRAVIAPDGLSLSGSGDDGSASDAVRLVP